MGEVIGEFCDIFLDIVEFYDLITCLEKVDPIISLLCHLLHLHWDGPRKS